MNKVKYFLLLIAICFCNISAFTQNKSASDNVQKDSLLKSVETMLFQQQKQQQIDSVKKNQLLQALLQATGDKQKTRILEEKLKLISINDSVSKAVQMKKIAELKKSAKS
jgi:hypothetical protein